jgi:hypothetical protein
MPGEQQPQLSAHDAAMVAKVDAAQAASQAAVDKATAPAQTAAAEVPQRPDNIPEKFWDAEKGALNTEALLKSYGELEAARTPPAKPGEQKPAEGDQAAAEAVKAAKLDMAALGQEFATTGALSSASYKALADAGYSQDLVDGYIAGQQAIAAQRESEGYALGGGKEAYTAMVSWAARNLSADEQAVFDTAVGGSPAQMKQAITALKAQYEAANGRDPQLIQGRSTAGGEGDAPFASRAEVTAAMRDPRYRNDTAYREMVERRVGLMDNF